MPAWFFGVLILAGALALFVLLVYLSIRSERKDWNGGRCDLCGGPWECFDVDSQGGRGYVCRNHEFGHYGPWISWPWVD
jgi:hypothetical protein